MINLWLIVGALIGWAASMIVLVVGIVSAALGGWFISPLLGMPPIHQEAFHMAVLLVSLAAAVVLLAIVNLFRTVTRADVSWSIAGKS